MHDQALPSRGTRRRLSAILAGILLCAVGFGPARAAGGEAIVIGDSLGVGVSMASGLSRLARNSVAIRGGNILGQLRQAPSGSLVFMSLGTNDAVGRVEGLDGDIQRIVAAAEASGHRLVWIGPPCVMKSWDTNAQKLDATLRSRLSGTSIIYVGMRDPSLCTAGARAKDGVHFTMSGYGQMWAKARAAAGYSGGRTALASLAAPRVKRRHVRKHRRARVAHHKDAPIREGAAGARSANAEPER